MQAFPDYVGMAVWYCEEVSSGRVPACDEERQGCQRFLDMRAQALSGRADFVWSDSHVIDVCDFVSKLPHVKAFAGLIVLEPVQCWYLAGIFGFREKATGLRWVRTVRVWIPRKNAKALALDTPIPTPSGWTTMGAVEPGDMVLGDDGLPTKVVEVSPVYLRHDCYEVTFSNGEKIIADAGHRWLTTARVDKVGAGIGQGLDKSGVITRVRTTEEIFRTQTYGQRGDRNHSVLMPAAQRGITRALPLDPYVFGAWLGDGTAAAATISVSAADAEHLRAQIELAGYVVSERKDRTCQTLTVRPASEGAVAVGEGARSRTLWPQFKALCHGERKTIPTEYLRASFKQRLALLQGLMDTDGTINKTGGCICFSASAPEIRDGMSELLATFGIKHTVNEKEATCNGRRLGTPYWLIQFFVDRQTLPVFRLPRKLERMVPAPRGRARSRTVQIVSVKPAPSVPVKCIAVDNASHLFLAGRTMVPTHNTTLSAGVVLYCANFEGEEGADVVVSAASEDQARIPYDVIRKMLGKDEDLREMTGAVDIKDGCEFTTSGGTIKLAHARAKNLDGFNPHVLLQEELHAQDQGVIGVLKTAQGSRQAPLDLGISTAGRDVNAPAYDDWKVCRQVLAGRLNAPRMFIAMYAGSEADKDRCFDPATVEKLNPMWGVSLNPTSIEEEAFEGRKSESKRQEYLRTRINFWSRAAGNLVSLEAWERCADPKLKLEVLKGFPLYVGIDLASRSDLNAAAYMVKAGDRVYATADYWLPAKCERLSDDRFADAFLAWHRQGWLSLTPGSFIDYRKILKQILATLDGHNVVGVGLDDYQANLMASEIEQAGYQVFIIQKNARNLTAATDDLVSRTADPELFQHDGNPVTAWCAGNVVGHYDQNANVLPKKEKPWSKANIDGFDALVEANALRLDHEAGQLGASAKKSADANPYLTRGLAGASA